MAKTDPARELATTLEQISGHKNANATLDVAIASIADVEPWSSDFFRVLFELVARCALVETEIARLALDEDVKDEAVRNIRHIRSYLNQKGVMSQLVSQSKNIIGNQNITILKMLSSQVRENISYDVVEDEDRKELLSDIAELIGWLREQQDEETDFIRQALIDGLEQFEFRLQRLGWFGAGYAIDGLRDLITAYLALQGTIPEVENGDELIRAILIKTKALMGKAAKAFNITKTSGENASWVLQLYGAASAIHDGSDTVTGLLGN